MAKINETLVKISMAAIPILRELEMQDEVTLVVRGEVVKVEDVNNFDGTVNRVFKVKGIIAEEAE